jgi:hypothetical protein
MVHLKKQYKHDNNTVIHNMIIVAQFLKKHGRGGLTPDRFAGEDYVRRRPNSTAALVQKIFAALRPGDRDGMDH